MSVVVRLLSVLVVIMPPLASAANVCGVGAAKSLNIILLQCVGLCWWPVHCFWAHCVQVKVYNDVTLGNGPNIV